jgi:hypothetical protein|mmetsp:Transcript_13265/g.34019  ORF Transcript_13265/g.34019 Transcript_13265/m.34019 type:complete len:85 (+) Transcript_13265:248-502(+)|eukprot:3596277-Prymnesium_polylepis.1
MSGWWRWVIALTMLLSFGLRLSPQRAIPYTRRMRAPRAELKKKRPLTGDLVFAGAKRDGIKKDTCSIMPPDKHTWSLYMVAQYR